MNQEQNNDGIAIKLIKHPQLTPLWKRILHIFKRPKFSKDVLENQKILYVVLKIGCIECGISSQIIGSSFSKEEAEQIKSYQDKKMWIEDSIGEAITEVFEVPLPRE